MFISDVVKTDPSTPAPRHKATENISVLKPNFTNSVYQNLEDCTDKSEEKNAN